ncbi:MAG: M28 family peptidase [Muribaculum sp.]|nr:M28 family peptidase [Muribaculum sp.]
MTLLSCTGNKSNAVAEPSAVKTQEKVDFNADSAYVFVKAQVDCGPRIPGSQGHSDCAEYIVGRLNAANADTVIEYRSTTSNFKGETMPINNIMARYNPDASRRVLLLAHWDTRPWADNDPDPANHTRPVPGANDGASGAGVLLELARLFGQKRPEIGVDLLFVDGEDSGAESQDLSWCLGTQQWINQMPYRASDRPVYAILLDMVGGRDARFTREYISDRYASAVNDRVWAMADVAGFGDRFINRQAGGVVDDHMFINRAGIPCIDIIECANESTGSFPPTWHTVNDNMDHIDPETLKAVGQTVANVIYNERQ